MAKVRSSRKVGKSTDKAAKEKRGRRGVASKPKATKDRRSPVAAVRAQKPPVAAVRVSVARPAEAHAAPPVVEVPKTPPPLPAPIASFVF
jgi:hypothetical protein